MAGTKAKGGKKGRKFGRNAKYAQMRAALGLEEKNRNRRIRRHQKWQAKKAAKLARKPNSAQSSRETPQTQSL